MHFLPPHCFCRLAQGNGTPGAGFVAEWDMSGTGAVTPADVAERRATLFEMFDLDGSGVLERRQTVMAQTIADREAVELEPRARAAVMARTVPAR